MLIEPLRRRTEVYQAQCTRRRRLLDGNNDVPIDDVQVSGRLVVIDLSKATLPYSFGITIFFKSYFCIKEPSLFYLIVFDFFFFFFIRYYLDSHHI